MKVAEPKKKRFLGWEECEGCLVCNRSVLSTKFWRRSSGLKGESLDLVAHWSRTEDRDKTENRVLVFFQARLVNEKGRRTCLE